MDSSEDKGLRFGQNDPQFLVQLPTGVRDCVSNVFKVSETHPARC
jgi:hypothetical protein